MRNYTFKIDATETINGQAYFSVAAESEQEALEKLVEDSANFFTEFVEQDGATEWDDDAAENFELLYWKNL